jgi:CRISPR-associated endonuclease Cas1
LSTEFTPELIKPRYGVVTLYGYPISLNVEHGQLILQDGVGPRRRRSRFARVGHTLRRVVVIGAEGFVSLAALKWMQNQNVTFLMLERNGKVLATCGPVSSSDVRLRRAQATAHQTGIALAIARELIDKKLHGQAHLVRTSFPGSARLSGIEKARTRLSTADSNDEIRSHEAQGAHSYWAAWHDLPVNFPRCDLPRVPDHWRSFGSRVSSITGSPRLAVNPANAMLNYLYSVLEAEARLALATVGLDPALGFLHNDLRARDSLACDVMEPVRPQADAFLLDWLKRSPLKREWFFEKADGNCRLMASLASELSQSAEIWKRAVAPFAEGIARVIWNNERQALKERVLPTLLTQTRRREARGLSPFMATKPHRAPANVCGICGKTLNSKYKHCRNCAPTIWRENVQKASRIGRQSTHSPQAQARRSETQCRQNAARKSWNPASNPEWLTERFYREQIQRRLSQIQVPIIQSALSVSEPYALRIRNGQCIPHPRHWKTLAKFASGVFPTNVLTI